MEYRRITGFYIEYHLGSEKICMVRGITPESSHPNTVYVFQFWIDPAWIGTYDLDMVTLPDEPFADLLHVCFHPPDIREVAGTDLDDVHFRYLFSG
jgi:hypothetical protein